MPKPTLGGYLYRDLAAAMAIGESNDIDKLQQAIELLFTEDPKGAARLIHEVARSERLRMKVHTLLQANDVEEAQLIYLNEIKPALISGE